MPLLALMAPVPADAAIASASHANWPWILLAVALAICLLALVMTLWNLRVLGEAPLDGPIADPSPAGPAAAYPSESSGTMASPTSPTLGASPGASAFAPLVSLCIPARNEAANLEACVRGVLACEASLRAALGPGFPADAPVLEVLVYDDQSTDETPAILSRLLREDSRVRAVRVEPLPDGWNGKQHACWRMAHAAKGQWLGFTDADVRFEPEALASSLRQAKRTNAAMISGFPRQETGTLSEALVVPMIFFILFSYLPFAKMRSSNDPSSSAGCGQFLLVRRDAYDAAGGHAAFKNSMHDGIKLPRNVRRAGFHSDLVDATDLLRCRMYRGWTQTWRGFAKNAYEGLGTPILLVFLTVMHLVGHVLPWVALVWVGLVWSGLDWVGSASASAAESPDGRVLALAIAACAVQVTQRVILARRLRTSMLGAVLHPLGVVLMTSIQWHSYWLHLTGRRSWRGRVATTARPAT